MKDRMIFRFLNALRTIYFCKDRKYENDSERVFAESALRKLWEYDEITVAGVRYTRREIRKAMFDEMIPETVDNALMYFRETRKPMSSDDLAHKIFEFTVDPNEAIYMLIAVKQMKDHVEKGDAYARLLSKVKVAKLLSRAE